MAQLAKYCPELLSVAPEGVLTAKATSMPSTKARNNKNKNNYKDKNKNKKPANKPRTS